MEKTYGCIKVIIERDYEAMSKKAADIFLAELDKNKNGVFGFATGSTPLGLYKELVNAAPDMSGITTFNLDEYYPIKKENPQSYHYFMWENLFSHVNVNKTSINLPNGEATNPDDECAKYDDQIRQAGWIDFQILGIGGNGHIGFNEPAEDFISDTHYTSLNEVTIKANARFFQQGEEVPAHALTMGIGTIMRSGKIMLLASGEGKAEIINKMLTGSITPNVPASVLRLHRDVVLVLDEAAAKML